MSAADPGILETISRKGAPWYKNRKLDQWLCFWTVPFFYNVFGIVFVPLSWMMPPRAPYADIASKIAFMQSPSLLVACVFLVAALGFAAVSNGVYLCQIRRMSVSPAFRITFLAATIPGAIVGALFPLFCFGLGSFRHGYRPEILAMLYDFGYLSFIGCLGCFFVTWSCFGLAIVLDKDDVLPKWLGYYTLWQAVTEIFATVVWVSHDGPFAWNGLLAFWFDMVIYVPWQMIVYVCIYHAIRNQPDRELANCQPVPHSIYA
jgi:hypothetical protein